MFWFSSRSVHSAVVSLRSLNLACIVPFDVEAKIMI